MELSRRLKVVIMLAILVPDVGLTSRFCAAVQVTTLLSKQGEGSQAAAAALSAEQLQQLRDKVTAQGTAVKDAKTVSQQTEPPRGFQHDRLQCVVMQACFFGHCDVIIAGRGRPMPGLQLQVPFGRLCKLMTLRECSI